ncbi:MAG TPA: hypothetical protein VGM33_00920 [Baekduia sp.]|jgi:hypothetical protein
MSTPQRNDARIVRVSTTQRASLREQTLEIVELEHHRFDDFADQSPSQQRASATLFLDALTVLDTLGWDTPPDAPPIDIPLTAGHVRQLEARYTELTLDALPTADLTAIISAYHQAAGA